MKKSILSLSVLSFVGFLIIVVLTACAPSPKMLQIEAEAKIVEEANDVASEFLSAFVAEDYQKAAALYAPESLTEFRQLMTALDMLKPEIRDDIYAQFFGSKVSADSVAKLSDAKYFGSFIKAVMGRAKGMSGMKIDSIQVLGGVPSGDTLVYVLTKSFVSAAGAQSDAIEVQTLVKTPQGFRTVVSEEMKQIAMTFESMLNQQEMMEQMNQQKMNEKMKSDAVQSDDANQKKNQSIEVPLKSSTKPSRN